jgi:TrkA domain protein
VEETVIPRGGRRHDLRTADGHHVAVVVHDTGRRDLIVYDDADPDAGRQVLALSEREADALAAVLATG